MLSEYSTPKERPSPSSSRATKRMRTGSVPPMTKVGGSTSRKASTPRSGSGPPPGRPSAESHSGNVASTRVTPSASTPVAASNNPYASNGRFSPSASRPNPRLPRTSPARKADTTRLAAKVVWPTTSVR